MYNQLFIGLLNCPPLSDHMRSHRESFLDFAFSVYFCFFIMMSARYLQERVTCVRV